MGNHIIDHDARLDWAPISETALVQQLLRMRARLHRLDIETALLLTEIEAGEDDEGPLGGLVDPRLSPRSTVMTSFGVEDEILFRIHARIATQGVCVEYVFGDLDQPSWAYTVGLLQLGHPEVIVFGLEDCCAATVIEHLLDEIRAGIVRPVGRNRRQAKLGDPGLPVRLVPVPDHFWDCAGDHRLCLAAAYFGALGWNRSDLRAFQLVWATRAGKFPWHAGASKRDRRRQPLLDRGELHSE